jgi:hypothetical protein
MGGDVSLSCVLSVGLGHDLEDRGFALNLNTFLPHYECENSAKRLDARMEDLWTRASMEAVRLSNRSGQMAKLAFGEDHIVGLE